MKKKRFKLFLSIFIVLSLTFALMIGLASITWAVPQSRILEVSTWDHLIAGLTNSDALEVKLMKDLEERYEFPLGQDTVSPEDAKKFIVIEKRINLDLNGHTLELINNTSYKNYVINNIKRPVYMFTIKDGGGLLIRDSSPKEKGEIRHHATLRDEKKSWWFQEANVFKVEKGGELAIDNGKIYAGRESRTWISAAPKDTQDHFLDILYTGYGYNMAGGTCITNEGGKAVVNGGKLTSFRTWKAPEDAGDVILHKGGRTILNGGTLDATGFAHVFNDKLKNKSLTIEGPLKITTSKRWVFERKYAYRSRYGDTVMGGNYIKLDYSLMTNDDAFSIDGKYYHNLYWTWKGEPIKSVLPDTKEGIEYLLKWAQNFEFYKDLLSISFELGSNDKNKLEFFIAEGETLNTKVFAEVKGRDRDIGLGRKPVFEVYSSYPGEEEFTVHHPKVFDDNYFKMKGEEKANGTHIVKVVELLGGKPASEAKRQVKINVTKDKIQPDLKLISEDKFLTVGQPYTITREVPNLAEKPGDGVYVQKTEWKYKGPTTNIITINTKTNNDSTVEIPGHSEPGSYFYYCTVTASNQTEKTEIISFIVSPEGSDLAKPIIDIGDVEYVEYGVPIRLYIGNKGGRATSWEIDRENLPNGLGTYIDNEKKLLVILGTPKSNKSSEYVTITAKNNMGEDTKKVKFIVKSPYTITTKEFNVEKYKNTKIQLKNNYPKDKNYQELWSIEKGSLPTGLTLNEKTGEITGIPTSMGRDYNVTFRVIPPPEYAPISGSVKIKLDAKTEFRKDKGNVLERTFPVGYDGYLFNNLLLEGLHSDTKFDIINAPFTCKMDYMVMNWHLMGKVPDKEGTYEFDLKATNRAGSDSVKVRVIAKEIATLKGDGKAAVQALLFAEKGKEYDSGNALPNYVNFPAKGDFEWSIEHTKGLSMDDFAKEYGLTFDKTTGKFTGKPLKTTGKNEDGSPKGELFRMRVVDKNTGFATDSIYTLLHIVEPGEIKAPTKISFEDGTKSKTIGRNTYNDIVIKIDGLPTPNISFTGNGAPPPGTEIFQPGIVFPMPVLRIETDFLGTYNFEIKAENSEGSTTAKLEIVVKEPERAETPIIKPAPGEYSKADGPLELSFEKIAKNTYTYYRIDDGDFKVYAFTPGEIKIKEDSVITAYSTPLVGKIDSEVVSFKYIFTDGPSPMAAADKAIDIKGDKLPDGEEGKKYQDYQMNGTIDGKKSSDIKWIATGLPFGMNISEGGVISGTPHVKGAFTVIIKAYANDGSYGEKQISLQINETKLPFAKKPEITKQPEKVINYKEDAPADVALKALAVEGKTSDGGTITYMWYKSADNKNDTFDDDKVVGQGQYHTPDIKEKGIKYYYAVVTNSKENHAEAIAFSNVSTINVLFNAEDPKFDGMEDRKYTMTEKTVQNLTETADTDDNGEINYKWYQMTGDKPDPTKDKEVNSEHSSKGILSVTVPSLGTEGKYYSVATNTNSNATGGKTSNSVIGPIHVITPTDKVAYKITFEVEKELKSVMQTDFDGKLEVLDDLVGEGYTLEGWYLDKEYKTKLTTDTVFTKDTTVYGKLGEPAEMPSDLPFADVKESDWFYDNVSYVYKSGLMNGTSPTTFGPGGNTTRAMIVTILHRMEGTPNVKGKNPFNDVPDGQYYTDAVVWAEENKIVSGYGEGKFGPNDPITREQMAVILMNYGKFKKYDVMAKGGLNKFADESKISAWAKDALSWANAKGLIQGSGDNVMPKGQAQRSQVAAILERFIEGYK